MTFTQWDSFLVNEREMIERAMEVLKKQLKKVIKGTHDDFSLKREIGWIQKIEEQKLLLD